MSFRSGIIVLAPLLIALPAAPAQTPEEALWSNIKTALLSEDGHKYFEENIRDAQLPTMKGIVVSTDSSEDPGTIVLAISDRTTPEVTLQIMERVSERDWRRASLPGHVARGDEIEFMGIGTEFTKNPFMLTLRVYADELKHLRSGDKK